MTSKLCVACAEEIQAAAKLCRFCGTLQDDPRFVDAIKNISATNVSEAEILAMSPELYNRWVRRVLGKTKFDKWNAAGRPYLEVENGIVTISPSEDIVQSTAENLLTSADKNLWLDSGSPSFEIIGGRLHLLEDAPVQELTKGVETIFVSEKFLRQSKNIVWLWLLAALPIFDFLLALVLVAGGLAPDLILWIVGVSQFILNAWFVTADSLRLRRVGIYLPTWPGFILTPLHFGTRVRDAPTTRWAMAIWWVSAGLLVVLPRFFGFTQ